MAISKNAPASELLVERWFNFKEAESITFQPVGPYYVVDAHSFKAIQGFYKTAPCSIDDFGACRMCSTYPIRKVLLTTAWDEADEFTKYLKLSKTAARQYIELIDKEEVEPTTTVFAITRWLPDDARPSNPKFHMGVREKDQLPKESDLGDMYDSLMTWMDPEHLARFVPNYNKLSVKHSKKKSTSFFEDEAVMEDVEMGEEEYGD